MSEVSRIVIDIGSNTIKAGFGGSDTPQSVFENVVGVAKTGSPFGTLNGSRTIVGSGTMRLRTFMSLVHPVVNRKINSWSYLEEVLNHTFYRELEADPEKHLVLFSEPPLPEYDYGKFGEIVFETLKVPASYLANQGSLSLYSAGRKNGIVVDIGDAVSHSIPIYEGHDLRHATIEANFGGKQLTSYLASLLFRNRSYSLTSQSELRIVREIKEKLCYAAIDFDDELRRSSSELEKPYTLPDGTEITIGNERFGCPEALFQPHLLGVNGDGIHETTYNSINKCDLDIQQNLYQNVLLAGGTSLLPTIRERMKKELQNLAPPSTKVNIIEQKTEYSVWIGGSVLSCLSTFEEMSVKNYEYQESGSNIFRRKCF